MPLYLFLDYDGTLVPIAATPERAVPPPEILRLLRALTATDGLRAAVVSGRDLPDLEALLPVPGLYLAACHGALIKPPRAEPYALIKQPEHRRLERLAAATRELTFGRTGFLVEPKTLSLALHYRLAHPAEAEAVLREFAALRERHCPAPGWETVSGRKVPEVRPAGVNKGAAVLHLLDAWPGACPVYIGDDVTDEDAFRALAGRGRTILVADKPRPTAAQQCLPRSAVLAFLHRLAL